MYAARLGANQRLNRSALRFAHKKGWRMSAPCERLLEKMVSDGVQRMERQQVLGQEEKLGLAESNLARFISQMANFAQQGTEYPLLVDADLSAAARRLCPLWPFC